MEFLPRSTILGDLSVIEICEYYDIPSLFSCKNSTGHIYLALSVDEDDTSLTWFYLPVSPGRLDEVRSGRTDLYDAFKNAEDGFLFEVITSHGKNDIVNQVYCKEIGEDLLPEKGYKLSVSEDSPVPISENLGEMLAVTLKKAISEKLDEVLPIILKKEISGRLDEINPPV